LEVLRLVEGTASQVQLHPSHGIGLQNFPGVLLAAMPVRYVALA
jgi:hypothetical protein